MTTSLSRKSRKGLAFTIVLVILLTIVSSSAYFLRVPVGAQLAANTTGSQVQGGIDLSNPGGESFWTQIPGTDIPLMPSIPYGSESGSLVGYGGMVSKITVKMAMNQTHMLVFATWSDPTESRSGLGVCYVLKDDNVTAHERDCLENESFPGLFYTNSTYAFEDRLVFWWNLDPTPGPAPCMTESAWGHGEGESLAGTGNLWHWKAGRTDSLGQKYGKLKFGSGPNKGQIITPSHSYAANEFINTTGHYVLGWDQYPTLPNPGNFTIGFADNVHQTYDPYLVAAHGVHDSSTNTWKWVAARPLTTSPSLHIVQFQPSQTYYFAVAVYDGGPITLPSGLPHPATIPLLGPNGWNYSTNLPFQSYGENEETKSISSWFTASFTNPSSGGTTGGLFNFGSFETTALLSLGMLVAGFVVGVVVITRFVLPKKPKA